MSEALQHCGYQAEYMADGGISMRLSTPFEGASVRAELMPSGVDGRCWGFALAVENNRGIGWSVAGAFGDCGLYVAKSMLRSMALELRRAYTHRGQKIHKRAIARAKAKAEAGKGGAE